MRLQPTLFSSHRQQPVFSRLASKLHGRKAPVKKCTLTHSDEKELKNMEFVSERVVVAVVCLLLSSSLTAAGGDDVITATTPSGFCNDDVDDYEIGSVDESLDGLDQEDPLLLEAVRSRVIPPDPNAHYNLRVPDDEPIAMTGQFDQVKDLVQIFGRSRRGFFIEAGAYDGADISNTFYFEKVLGWTGILVEPNPDAFADLLKLKRKSYAFGHCLSPTATAQVVDFDVAGLLGGIVREGQQPENEGFFDTFASLGIVSINRRIIKAQCFPLYTLIQAVGNRTVDLLVLDVEGAEFEILKTIPWDKVDVKVMMIEVEHYGREHRGSKEDLQKFLEGAGYKLYKKLFIDEIYVKKDFELPKSLKKPEARKN